LKAPHQLRKRVACDGDDNKAVYGYATRQVCAVGVDREVHSRSRSVRARASAVTAVAHGSFCRSRASGSLCVAIVACCVARRRMWNRIPGYVRNPADPPIDATNRSAPDPFHSWNSRQLIPQVARCAMPNIAKTTATLCTACSCRLQRAFCFYQLECHHSFVGRPLFSLTGIR
jgi:hypothetical protein